MVPELLNAPMPQEQDDEIEHNPGLMAAFRRGVRGAEEDGDDNSGNEDGGGADGGFADDPGSAG
jgi:hypothetical protein